MIASSQERRRIMACTAVVVVLGLCAVALFSPPGVDRVVRPVLSGLASRLYDTDVSMEHLEWTASHVKAESIVIITGSGDEVRIRSLDIRYHLWGLLHRTLEGLQVVSPHLKLHQREPSGTETTTALPEEFPVTVKEFVVTDGDVCLERGETELRIWALDVHVSAGTLNTFEVDTTIGEDPGVPVHAQGSVSWTGKPAIVLENIAISEQSLLSEPLHLSWAPEEGALGGGRFGIEHVDHLMVSQIAHALGSESPVPMGLTFELSGTDLRIDQAQNRTTLNSRIEKGRICQERTCLPVGKLSLSIILADDQVRLDTELGLGHGTALQVSAEKTGADLSADFRAQVPDVAAEVTGATGVELKDLQGGLALTGTCRTGPEDNLSCLAQIKGLAPLAGRERHPFSLAPLQGDVIFETSPVGWSAKGNMGPKGKPLVTLEGKPDQIQWRVSALSLADLSEFVDQGGLPAWLKGVEALRSSGQLTGFSKAAWSFTSRTSVQSIATTAGTPMACEFVVQADPTAGGQETAVTVSASVAAITETPGIRVTGGLKVGGSCLMGPNDTATCNMDFRGTGDRDLAGKSVDIRLESVHGHMNFRGTRNSWAGTAQLLLSETPLLKVTADEARLSWELALNDLSPVRSVVGSTFWPDMITNMTQVRSDGQLDFLAEGGVSGNTRISAERMDTPWGTAERANIDLSLVREGHFLELREVSLSTRISGTDLPSGELVLKGSGRVSEDFFRLNLASFRLDGAEFLSADGLSGFTGGTLEASGLIEKPSSLAPLHMDLKGQAGVGEVLAGRFYADLSPVKPVLRLKAIWDSSLGQLNLDQATVAVESLGDLSLTGRISRADFRVESTVQARSLSKFVELFGPGLGDVLPTIAASRVSGGVDAHLEASGTPAAFGISGTITLDDLSLISEPLDVEARGISGRVPVDLHSAGLAPAGTGEETTGSVEIASLKLGPLRLTSPGVTLGVRTNRMRIVAPLAFDLAGGRIGLEGVSLQREQGGVGVEGHLRIEDVDLEKLTKELNLPLMKGRVTADLGNIRYTEQVLASDGDATVRVFGGDIRIRNLYMDNPLSRFRTVHGDMDFTNLDLHGLSQTFEFGEMNGTVDGYVHELRLFEATPSRFVARVETRKKGKRDISVKALNNLSIISQGGITSVLSRGMYRFIDFYRYEKIGIQCELENDVFTLTGTAREGSDRYLVYGGLLPPRIDIVAPGHRISFKEMLKRIKRVDRKRG